MKNVYPIKSPQLREHEAADWLIKLDGDKPLTAQQKQALRQWLAASEDNRKELIDLNVFWANKVLTELRVPLCKRHTKTQHKKWVALAASVVLVLALAFMQSTSFENDQNGLYATTIGQQKTLNLSDGSVLQMNTDSQIEVAYDRDYRNIRLLQGEAYFTVAKNAQRPFRVHAGASRVIAVGTAFGVYMRQNEVDVTVLEGRVALAVNEDEPESIATIQAYKTVKRGAANILDAGQSVSLKHAVSESLVKAIIKKVPNVNERELTRRFSWREGLLTFHGDRLEDVVKEINRYSHIDIEISDPAVRDIRIGGQFKVGDTDQMLVALQANFGLEVTQLGYQHLRLDTRK